MNQTVSTTPERGGFRLPRFTLGITALATTLFWLFGPAPETLVFDRLAIDQGEWWRLLTGHLVHSDFEHAFWDLLAFALIGALLEQFGTGRTITAAITSLVLIDGWLWWGEESLRWYCGLSGIVNTLLALLLYQYWREARSAWLAICAIAYGGKLLFENVDGNALLTTTAWPSLPSVHVVGLAAAAVLAIAINIRLLHRVV